MFADLVFYMFATILLLSAAVVISARNPMYCVMALIMCFLNASGLFILMGAEFLGLLMVMVYVGAVAVLFLFVLMTIDIDFAVLKEGFASYLPVGLLMGVVLMVELVIATSAGLFWGGRVDAVASTFAAGGDENILALGKILFTNFFLPFQMAGMLLLVAMVGAIVLTHRKRDDVRRQDISKQIARRREDAVKLVKVRPGQGA